MRDYKQLLENISIDNIPINLSYANLTLKILNKLQMRKSLI